MDELSNFDLMEQPTDLCPNCEGTRWEHSEEQWIYCHLPADYRANLTDDSNSLVVEKGKDAIRTFN